MECQLWCWKQVRGDIPGPVPSPTVPRDTTAGFLLFVAGTQPEYVLTEVHCNIFTLIYNTRLPKRTISFFRHLYCIYHHHHRHHHHRHNSPLWAKAFFRSFCQLSLFLAAFLQFVPTNFMASSITPSSITSSSHLSFGLPPVFFLLPLQRELFLYCSVPPYQ